MPTDVPDCTRTFPKLPGASDIVDDAVLSETEEGKRTFSALLWTFKRRSRALGKIPHTGDADDIGHALRRQADDTTRIRPAPGKKINGDWIPAG